MKLRGESGNIPARSGGASAASSTGGARTSGGITGANAKKIAKINQQMTKADIKAAAVAPGKSLSQMTGAERRSWDNAQASWYNAIGKLGNK